jgi:predicted metalloendopeptidase
VPASQVQKDEEIFNKAKQYYQSYHNECLINNRGASPLHPLLEKLGTIFEDNAKNNRAAITRAFAYLNQFSITPLIKFAVYSDISHPDTYGVYVFQSGLMLSIREKYNDSSILELYSNAATETWFKISQNFDLPGIDSDIDISRAVENAINFENHISLITNSS